jgi:hypothetical protein
MAIDDSVNSKKAFLGQSIDGDPIISYDQTETREWRGMSYVEHWRIRENSRTHVVISRTYLGSELEVNPKKG